MGDCHPPLPKCQGMRRVVVTPRGRRLDGIIDEAPEKENDGTTDGYSERCLTVEHGLESSLCTLHVTFVNQGSHIGPRISLVWGEVGRRVIHMTQP